MLIHEMLRKRSGVMLSMIDQEKPGQSRITVGEPCTMFIGDSNQVANDCILF